MPHGPNDAFLEVLRNLIDGWCDRRSFRPLSRILGPYVSFNGMTDGWGDLAMGLRSIRNLDWDELTASEHDAVEALIRASDKAIYER